MPLILTDEQKMLAESAKGFLAEHAPVAELRKLRDERSADGFSRPLWAKMAEMGWAGVLVPESHGGLDFGHVGAGLICEEMGRTLAASPFLTTSVMAATALRAKGSKAQQERWLPAIAEGRAIFAVAVDEGRKHNPAATALKAAKQGNAYRLDGAKTFVADGHVADQIIVAARTAGSPGETAGLSLFLVDGKAKGLSVERTIMLDSRNAARLTFDGVSVDGADVIGDADDGYGLLESVLDAGRAGLAAEMSGIAQESFERTLQYIKDRTQFGKPIGSFQALQHRAAHLYCEIEMAKSAVLKALQTLDEKPEDAPAIVALAKSKTSDVASLAVREAVQMHGGIGMTDQLDIGLFMKRARAAIEMYGDASFHADRLAVMRGY
jgi:alkylation response protein AidB-like acyl-CoA dehydrogenase